LPSQRVFKSNTTGRIVQRNTAGGTDGVHHQRRRRIDDRVARRPRANRPQARLPNPDAWDSGARQSRGRGRAQTPAVPRQRRRPIRVRTGRQHAIAWCHRRHRLRAAVADHDRIKLRDSVRVGRQRRPGIDPDRRGQHRRRIGAGILGERRAHRPAVTQGQPGRWPRRHRHVAGHHTPDRGPNRDLARRHRRDHRIDAVEHRGERRQPRDPLSCIDVRRHCLADPDPCCWPRVAMSCMDGPLSTRAK
jgi:hypothetical protein